MRGMRSRFWITVCICLAFLGWSGCTLTGDDPSEKVFIKYFGEDGNQEGVDMLVAADGFYLLGNTSRPNSSNGRQILLLKTDFNGNEIGRWEFGGPGDDFAKDIEFTLDGNLVIGANSVQAVTGSDAMILKVSLSGQELGKTVVGFGGSDENVSSVSVLSDGSFVLMGSTNNVTVKPDLPPVGIASTDTHDMMHLRFDSNLGQFSTTLWKQVTGFDFSEFGVKLFEILPPPTTGPARRYYVFGYSNVLRTDPSDATNNFNYWITSISQTGDPVGSSLYTQLPGNSNEFLSAVEFNSNAGDLGYLLTGVSRSASRTDIYVVKTKPVLNFEVTGPGSYTDIVFSQQLQLSLGNVSSNVTNVFPTSNGYFVVSNAINPATGGSTDWLLTRVEQSGGVGWTVPVLLGGGGEDSISSVKQLPDGSIVVFGTFEIGSDRREKKMTLIKLTKDGKLQPE